MELVYEVFSLPLEEAAKMKRAIEIDGKLYEKLVGRLDTGGLKHERFLAVMGRLGEEVMLVDVEEYMYWTEWEPPEGVANSPSLLFYKKSYAPVAASAFDTNNLGDALEVGLQWGDAEIRLTGSHDALLKRNAFGEGMVFSQGGDGELLGTTQKLMKTLNSISGSLASFDFSLSCQRNHSAAKLPCSGFF